MLPNKLKRVQLQKRECSRKNGRTRIRGVRRNRGHISDPIKEHTMPKYIDVHDGFVGVTQDQLAHAHEADLEIQAEEGVQFERAWLDPRSGKAFCLSTGPSKEAVMRIHERAGHPTSEIYEVTVEVH
jgi:hypothetical protein